MSTARDRHFFSLLLLALSGCASVGRHPPPRSTVDNKTLPPASANTSAIVALGTAQSNDLKKYTQLTGVRQHLGPVPAWVDGNDDAICPASVYYCAVGRAADAVHASNAAYTLLKVRLAQVSIASRNALLQTYQSKLNAASSPASKLNFGGIDTALVVNALQASRVLELWQAPHGHGSVHALVCLERLQATAFLRQDMAKTDDELGKLASSLPKLNDPERQSSAERAANLLLRRSVSTALFRSFFPQDVLPAERLSVTSLATLMQVGKAPTRVSIQASGHYFRAYYKALADALRRQGYDVLELIEAPKPTDVVIVAKLVFQEQPVHAKHGAGRVDVTITEPRPAGMPAQVYNLTQEQRGQGNSEVDAELHMVDAFAKETAQRWQAAAK